MIQLSETVIVMFSHTDDKFRVPSVICPSMSEQWISQKTAERLGFTVSPVNQIISAEFEGHGLVSQGTVQVVWYEEYLNLPKTQQTVFQVTSKCFFNVLLKSGMNSSEKLGLYGVLAKLTKKGKLIHFMDLQFISQR